MFVYVCKGLISLQGKPEVRWASSWCLHSTTGSAVVGGGASLRFGGLYELFVKDAFSILVFGLGQESCHALSLYLVHGANFGCVPHHLSSLTLLKGSWLGPTYVYGHKLAPNDHKINPDW